MSTNEFCLSNFKHEANPSKHVSFDMFDTLVHRCVSPETIILQTCYNLAEELGLDGKEIYHLRHKLAGDLRENSAKDGADYEYSHQDLASVLAATITEKFKVEPALNVANIVQAHFETEVDLEIASIRLNYEMLPLVEKAFVEAKSICVISDMYLSAEALARILKSVKLDAYFNARNIYVSGDIGLNKASGRLFTRVLNDLGCDPHDLAHIGDNFDSDYAKAKAIGIRAYHYDANEHHARYKKDFSLRYGRLGFDNLPVHDAACGALNPFDETHKIAMAIAPTLCWFAQSVAERAKILGVETVWFMARDGFVPMILYNMLDDGTFPKAKYLYVSRKSTSGAGALSFGIKEAFMAQWNGEGRTLEITLKPAGLTFREVDNLALRYGFDGADDLVDISSDPRFHKMLRDAELQRAFADVAELKTERLNGYLSSIGFTDAKKVAVVDVGWAGQIQEAIEDSLSKCSSAAPEIHGLYMALRDYGALRRKAGIKAEGLLYDADEHDWMASCILNAVDVFEDACRSQEGSVYGYDDAFKVILASDSLSRQGEELDDARLAALQAAIYRYAEAWKRYVQAFNVPDHELEALAIKAAARLTTFPTVDEAKFFTSMGHGLDAGNDTMVANAQIVGGRIKLKLDELRHSRWKEAAATNYLYAKPLQFMLAVVRHRRSRMHPGGSDIMLKRNNGMTIYKMIELLAGLKNRSPFA